MSEATTKPTDASVQQFLDGIADERRRADTADAVALAREVTGAEPTMWGPSIIGFGTFRYRYPTGNEGSTPRIGLSPRKAALTFYGLQDCAGSEALLDDLGEHTLGKGCVYVKRLDRVDTDALRRLMQLAWTERREHEID